MTKSRPTIKTTTPIAIPMARQLVSRSSPAGFGWMNPPMGGFYYSGWMCGDWGTLFTTATQSHGGRQRNNNEDSGGRSALSLNSYRKIAKGRWCYHLAWGPSTAFGWRLISLRMTAGWRID